MPRHLDHHLSIVCFGGMPISNGHSHDLGLANVSQSRHNKYGKDFIFWFNNTAKVLLDYLKLFSS